VTFPNFLSLGLRESHEGGDRGIPPLRKRPRKDGAPRAKPPSKPLALRYDTKRDVLINYEPNDPKMQHYGFSGAATWIDRAEHSGYVWTASPMIFGVQTSWFETSGLLQVVGAPAIREFLEKSF
jgi:hypothetical protein